MEFSISTQTIDPNVLKSLLADAGAGACVIFEGWVRNLNEGQPVTALEYEAYPALAEKEGAAILIEARHKFKLQAALAVHRSGKLAIGDLAVWVGVSSAHRADAFEASRYIIDEIKARVPIWKKEHYTAGTSQWINCATRGQA
jgi:molybdopterin synthase catalytic subunit